MPLSLDDVRGAVLRHAEKQVEGLLGAVVTQSDVAVVVERRDALPGTNSIAALANASSSASEASGEGGSARERHDQPDLAGVTDAAPREVVVKQERRLARRGGHLNGAPQTPTTARPAEKFGNHAARCSAPRTE